MAESAKEIDLDPRKYVGLSFPLRSDNNNDFALTKNSLQQASHNLKNLLLTHPGEILNQPEFGSTLRAICFEQNNSELPGKVEEEIRRSVSFWLPYINISNVNVIENETNPNQMKVSIDFSLNYDPNRFNTITLDIEGE